MDLTSLFLGIADGLRPAEGFGTVHVQILTCNVDQDRVADGRSTWTQGLGMLPPGGNLILQRIDGEPTRIYMGAAIDGIQEFQENWRGKPWMKLR
jgi:hypothetical protein